MKYMFMALATSLVVLFYCCATADILTKLLQQCFLFLFFIVVVIPGQQVSVYRTIGLTLVLFVVFIFMLFMIMKSDKNRLVCILFV